ncbi:hypothetical protein, partial [Acrocarpospora phusangensis]|uniref:hypothetical protein n=1 Tax=Acrocarpospora phusangensis TaxID=1070424 RepID=UPI0019513A8A
AGLLGATPAHANPTTKERIEGPTGLEGLKFAGGDISSGVAGVITFKVFPNGSWNIAADAGNGNIAGRWYRWRCLLEFNYPPGTQNVVGTVSFTTGREWVPGWGKRRSITASGNFFGIASGFNQLVDHGTAECDIVIG